MRTYAIQAVNGGPIKIGSTRKPVQERLRQLQTGSPLPLRVIAELDGLHHERELHHQFADWRLEGEWFDEDAKWLMLMLGVDCQADEHHWVLARVWDGIDDFVCDRCAESCQRSSQFQLELA